MASPHTRAPERLRPPGRWFALGALLPVEVRRRLFEPAYYDLLREELARNGEGSGWTFAWRAAWLLLVSCFQGIALLLRDPKRRRKLIVRLAWMAIVAALLMTFLLREWIGFVAANL